MTLLSKILYELIITVVPGTLVVPCKVNEYDLVYLFVFLLFRLLPSADSHFLSGLFLGQLTRLSASNHQCTLSVLPNTAEVGYLISFLCTN